MASKSNISFYRENTVSIALMFAGVDLTGATVSLTVKVDYDDDQTDSSAVVSKDVTSHDDPTNGKTTVVLTPADTDVEAGSYVYDIRLKKSSGEITTVAVGKCTVRDVVTLRA